MEIRKMMSIIEIDIEDDDYRNSILDGVDSYVNSKLSNLKLKAVNGSPTDLVKYNSALSNQKIVRNLLGAEFRDIYSMVTDHAVEFSENTIYEA